MGLIYVRLGADKKSGAAKDGRPAPRVLLACREGFDEPVSTVIAWNDNYIVVKVPGHNYFGGMGRPRPWAPTHIYVHRVEKVVAPNSWRGIRVEVAGPMVGDPAIEFSLGRGVAPAKVPRSVLDAFDEASDKEFWGC